MDAAENTRSTIETMTIEWELYSPYFDDILIIVPRNLNSITITSQYEEVLPYKLKKDTSKWSTVKTVKEEQKDTFEIQKTDNLIHSISKMSSSVINFHKTLLCR